MFKTSVCFKIDIGKIIRLRLSCTFNLDEHFSTVFQLLTRILKIWGKS